MGRPGRAVSTKIRSILELGNALRYFQNPIYQGREWKFLYPGSQHVTSIEAARFALILVLLNPLKVRFEDSSGGNPGPHSGEQSHTIPVGIYFGRRLQRRMCEFLD